MSPSSTGLPEGWKSAKDPVSGREYFFHVKTNETSWDVPQSSSAPTDALDDATSSAARDIAQVSLHDEDDRKMNDSTMPPPPSRVTGAVNEDKKKAAPAAAPLTTAANNDKSTVTPVATTAPTSKKSSMPAPPPRNKKRFGLGDWNLLLRTANDLALRRGAPLRKIRWKEIRQHNTKYDGWVVILNKVFFITPYLAYHPGGEAILVKCLGKDATALYDKYHQWVNLEALIGKLQIGYLDTSHSDDDDSDEEDDTAGLSLPDHLALSRR